MSIALDAAISQQPNSPEDTDADAWPAEGGTT
jgi:hypothetical protein